jgi:hypothetical protein
MATTPAEQLLARLRAELPELDLPTGTRLRRVYPSSAMRNLGAWSWCAEGSGGEDLRVGSRHPMAELLGASVLVVVVEEVSVDLSRPDRTVTYPGGEV